MARMLPPLPGRDAPASERRIFARLAREPGTEDWVVIHSLGLTSSYTGEYGEIDFLILIPGHGVLCVEVKGGGVSARDGQWTSIDRHGVSHRLKRSPFAQVRDAMFKLGKAVRRRFGDNSPEGRCAIGSLVVLPDVACPPPTPEFTRKDVIDATDLEGPIADLFRKAPSLLTEAARGRGVPDRAMLARLQTFFRPDFERVPTAGASLRPIEEQLSALTEEQYGFLDAVDFNSRCIVLGAAGTGKTTLAVEHARRLSAAGKRVLLACFNRRLGDWLAARTSGFGPGTVVAGSLHQLLSDRIRASTLAREFARHRDHPDLFRTLYPLYGAMAVTEAGERFDAILIDEAQDFHADTLVGLCEAWLAPGDASSIVFFGDYTRQAIYDASGDSLDTVRQRFPQAAVIPLRRNCRNTRRIAQHTSALSGFTDLQLNPGQPEGDPVETWFCRDADEQAGRLAELFSRLKAGGIAPADVVVLGRLRLEKSGLAATRRFGPWSISDGPAGDRHTVAFSTVHAFKGLEAPVIVLVDVCELSTAETEALLYVGMSRARSRLYMLLSQDCRAGFDACLARNLKMMVSA